MKNVLINILGKPTIWRAKNFVYKHLSREFISRVAFYRQFICKGDVCFDIGANVGNRTAVFLALGAKVVAAEPLDFCREILQAKFGRRINIVPQGLGAEIGQKEFYVGSTSTLSTLSTEWIDEVKKQRFPDEEWSPKQMLQITTLDELISKYGKPNFLKIDVEGYELEVLKGLSEPIDYISFEYTIPEQTEALDACIRYVASLGETVFNYSVSESMQLGTDKWMQKQDMLSFVKTEEFRSTGFGDVYCKAVK